MVTNKNFLSTKIIYAVLLLCSSLIAVGQQKVVNIDALTSETQKMLSDPGRITMVWWIPAEFWKATFDRDPSVSKEGAETVIKTFRPYTVLVVVDGKIGSFGGVTYKTEATLRSSIQITDGQGISYGPLSDELIDADTKSLLVVMKPVFSNMLGQMGQNMCFILFPSVNKANQKIIDPFREGTFSVKLEENIFKWTLPLGSLIPSKICPVDNQELSGAWNFCPVHGNKLVTNTIK
jgi:hypothetical protein